MAAADLHELSGAFALDALDGEELSQFEAHLLECAECEREVDSFRAAAAMLAATVETTPPTHLAAAVFATAATRQQVRPPDALAGRPDARSGRPRDGIDVIVSDEDLVAAGGAQAGDRAAAVVVPLGGWRARRRSARRWLAVPVAAAAAAALAVVSVRLVQAEQRVDRYREIAEVAAAPDARAVELTGAAGRARVVFDPDANRAVVTADGLPAVGDGQTYQLWLLDGTGATPAGLFRPGHDAKVQEVLVLDVPAATTGMGVTLEPRKGSAKPTTPVVLAGQLTT
jgi:hypothetical protein